jgi:chromate transporter
MEIFRAFLALGLTSFGGPVAHLGYMRREFVSRRGWLDEGDYAQLLAICQFLPARQQPDGVRDRVAARRLVRRVGRVRRIYPAVRAADVRLAYVALGWQSEYAKAATHGIEIGRRRGGGARGHRDGAPTHAGYGATPHRHRRRGGGAGQPHAVDAACGDRRRRGLGQFVCRRATTPKASALDLPVRAWHVVLFGAYAILLALALLVSVQGLSPLALFAAFYRTGALVFGGGHVVLPLLQTVVSPGWVSQDTFLAGTAPHRPCPGRCSRWPPSSARRRRCSQSWALRSR